MLKSYKNFLLNILMRYIDKYQALSENYKKKLVYLMCLLLSIGFLFYIIALHNLYTKNYERLQKAEQIYTKINYLSQNIIKPPNLEQLRNSLVQQNISIITLTNNTNIILEAEASFNNIITWLQNNQVIIKEITIEHLNGMDKSIVKIQATLE